MNVPLDLRELYHHGRLIPFVGAGGSMGVHWTQDGKTMHGPSWRELVDLAIGQLGIAQPDLIRCRGNDLQILEYYKLVNHGLARLTNLLYANMRPPDDALRQSAFHKALSRLTECSIIYTTNYDDFIERAFMLHGRTCRVIAIEAHMGSCSDGTEIVKFHGDFNHPDGMVLTESDYERRLKLSTEMDLRLRSDLLGRSLLFLGYSFSDANVAYLFRLTNEQFGGLAETRAGRRAYIVVPDPSDFERRLFQSRNVEIIPVSRDRLTEDIVELLDELRS